MTFYSWVGSTARKWFGSLYVLQLNTNFSHPFCWKSLSPSQCAVRVSGFTSKGSQPSTKWLFQDTETCDRSPKTSCLYNTWNVDMIISLWNHHQGPLKRLRLWLLAGYIAHCHIAIESLAGFGIHVWWWNLSAFRKSIVWIFFLLWNPTKKRQQTWEPPPFPAFRSSPVPSFPWHWVNAA